MPRDLEPLTYTVPEAAVVLGVSDDTVRLLVERGQLPAMRIGRRTLISTVRLADWIVEHADSTFAGFGEKP